MLHSGNRVNKKMFEEWTVKFPWLIQNIIKEQMSLSCKNIPGTERHTNVLTKCSNVIRSQIVYQ